MGIPGQKRKVAGVRWQTFLEHSYRTKKSFDFKPEV